MPSNQPHSTSSPTPGPNLLEERSIGGILAHLVAIPTGAVGAGLVYLVATSEFTRRNARNALDWHLTVLGLTALTFGSLFGYAELTAQGVANLVVLPATVSSVAGFVVSALLVLWMGVSFWSFLVAFVATAKATFGGSWRYPFAPALVERFGSRVERPDGWPVVLAGYSVAAPIVVGVALFGPRDGVGVLASGVGLVGLIAVGTPVAAVGVYLHGERDRPTNATWRPRVGVYVGAPVVSGVVAYLLSETFTDSINPAGDATYVFLGAFWVASLVYVARWWTATSA